MTHPRPGRPVRGSATGRPIMAAFDLLGRRWVLRVLWELREGPLTFRALQQRCDTVSPSVLNQRLHDLRDAQLVVLETGQGYGLTDQGQALLTALAPLDHWAKQWAHTLPKEGNDAT